MSTQPKAPAKMTDPELIEAVATEVMGLEIVESNSIVNEEGKIRRGTGYPREGCLLRPGSGYEPEDIWNPIKDWNHAMEVAEKVSAVWKIHKDGRTKVQFGTAGWYLEADEPRRAICIAALRAVRFAK